MDVKAHVDEVWKLLGTWGRYQIFQLTYVYFGMVTFAFTFLGIVFLGYTPEHRCKKLSAPINFYLNYTDDNVTEFEVKYSQCNVEIRFNVTNGTDLVHEMPCVEGYEYDAIGSTIVTEWDLVCANAGLAELTQTLILVGSMMGALIFPSISDRFGRKPVFVINIFIVFVLSMSLTFVNSYALFAVLRFLNGTFLEGFGLASAIYTLEIFPKECRGKISAIGAIGWGVCVVLLSPFGYLLRDYSWRYLQAVIALSSAYGLVSYWFLDESLRWLVANDKSKDTKRVVEKAAKWNKLHPQRPLNILFHESLPSLSTSFLQEDKSVDFIDNHEKSDMNTIREVEEELTANDVERYNVFTILKNKVVLKMSMIIWFTWLTNSLTYYGLFLTSSKLAGNRFLNYFLSSAIEIPAAICYAVLVNRIGRKRSSIFFHCIAGISLILSVILVIAKENVNGAETASSVFSLIGKFGISASFCVIFLHTPEMYPTNLRNAGIGMASTFAKFGGMVAPYSSLLASKVAWAPGVIFGSFCLLVTVLTMLLPETKGLELPQFLGELSLWYKQQSGNQFETLKRVFKSENKHTKGKNAQM